jgi:hypothetical protein
MIHYQVGDIDAYRAATRPPPRRRRHSARRFFPKMRAGSRFWADCRWTTVRHLVAPRNVQVIDEDPNRHDKGGHMSFVTTQPALLTEAAGNLTGIGSAMNAENSTAAAATTGVIPAAADQVSALTAAQFAAHAQMYQVISAQAAAIHEMFVNTLGISSGSYAATEAANAVAAT